MGEGTEWHLCYAVYFGNSKDPVRTMPFQCLNTVGFSPFTTNTIYTICSSICSISSRIQTLFWIDFPFAKLKTSVKTAPAGVFEVGCCQLCEGDVILKKSEANKNDGLLILKVIIRELSILVGFVGTCSCW